MPRKTSCGIRLGGVGSRERKSYVPTLSSGRFFRGCFLPLRRCALLDGGFLRSGFPYGLFDGCLLVSSGEMK